MEEAANAQRTETHGDDQTAEYAKFGGKTVQDVLAGDQRPPRAAYLESSYRFIGDDDIPVERYISQAYFDQEVEKVWRRTWQVACRDEELAEPGDYVVYDIVDDSILLTRTAAGEIKAYVNACLHRGTALCEGKGHAKAFRCPFHGFTWSLEGTLRWVPAQWDFPHLDKQAFRLPEVKVGNWGGFVFINLDPEAAPLSDYLELLPAHLDGDELARRYKAAHVSQIVPCNWKVLQEAFIEGYHVSETHRDKDEEGNVNPNGGAMARNDTGIEYDFWPDVKHINRLVYVAGVPSQYVIHKYESEQQVLNAMLASVPPEKRPQLAPDEAAREVGAKFMREMLAQRHRVDLSETADLEVLDQVQYNIFPNFTVWTTVNAPLCYRFRPNGRNVDEAIFEIWFLYPRPEYGDPPMVAEEQRLGPDELWASVPQLGPYGPVVDQDIPNLARLQKGLKATRKPGVTLANYQEVRIRHFHQTLDDYMNR
jgi:phenylpropionate dioxygenase-like ring-hydroxylating dioxygenase large terminal subunit